MKIPKKYKEYKGWVLDVDRTGAIMFCNGEIAVYCSPNWEGYKGVCIEVMPSDGETTYEEIPCDKLTPEKWFEIVKPYLDKYEKQSLNKGA